MTFSNIFCIFTSFKWANKRSSDLLIKSLLLLAFTMVGKTFIFSKSGFFTANEIINKAWLRIWFSISSWSTSWKAKPSRPYNINNLHKYINKHNICTWLKVCKKWYLKRIEGCTQNEVKNYHTKATLERV